MDKVKTIMDISLFISQLNPLVQTTEDHTCLEGVCDLLRIHTCSAVELVAGDVDIRLFYDDSGKGSHDISLPIIAGDVVLGVLTLRRNTPFGEAENLAAQVAASICTILLKNKEGQTTADKKRRLKSVRNVINTLSFSELEAATNVIKTLGGRLEGLLIAGRIADESGFTRSVVTAALRKLEGAGLIETRSLGMKGTYICIKNTLLADELGKL